MKKVSFLALLAVCLTAANAAYTLDSYPDFETGDVIDEDPKSPQQVTCGPRDVDRVCDPDGLLQAEERAAVQQQLYNIEHGEETQLPCGGRQLGFQVAFAVASKVYVGFDKEETIEEMAKGLHDRWGVGHAECQDGIVLFISKNDRHMFISTGRGAKEIVTDDVITAIIERMRPLLRSGRFSDALLQASQDLAVIINPKTREDNPVAKLVQKNAASSTTNYIGVLCWIGMAVGIFVFAMYKEKQYARQLTAWEQARARLQEMERLRSENRTTTTPEAQTSDADPSNAAPGGSDAGGLRRRAAAAADGEDPLAARMTCCPICLEDFAPAQQPASDEPTAPNATNQSDRTLRLPCRHKFHERCIDQWLGGQARNTCPVCRTPAFRPDGTPLTEQDVRDAQQPRPDANPRQHTPHGHGSNPPSCAAPAFGYRARYRYDNVQDMLFLMRSLHRRYPTYITRQQLESYERDPTTLNSAPLSSAPAFTSAKPVKPSSGKSSRSGGFGGGSSRGGGGRGGGW